VGFSELLKVCGKEQEALFGYLRDLLFVEKKLGGQHAEDVRVGGDHGLLSDFDVVQNRAKGVSAAAKF
jgi:hypothetical protein